MGTALNKFIISFPIISDTYIYIVFHIIALIEG